MIVTSMEVIAPVTYLLLFGALFTEGECLCKVSDILKLSASYIKLFDFFILFPQDFLSIDHPCVVVPATCNCAGNCTGTRTWLSCPGLASPCRMSLADHISFLSPCILDQWEWGEREGKEFRGKMTELMGNPLNRSRRSQDQMPVVFIPEVKEE